MSVYRLTAAVSKLLCVPLQAVSRRTVIYIISYCIYRLLCYIILQCPRYIRPPAGGHLFTSKSNSAAVVSFNYYLSSIYGFSLATYASAVRIIT